MGNSISRDGFGVRGLYSTVRRNGAVQVSIVGQKAQSLVVRTLNMELARENSSFTHPQENREDTPPTKNCGDLPNDLLCVPSLNRDVASFQIERGVASFHLMASLRGFRMATTESHDAKRLFSRGRTFNEKTRRKLSYERRASLTCRSGLHVVAILSSSGP